MFGKIEEHFLDESPRIVQLATETTWRGGESQALLLMLELRRRGLEQVLACAPGSPLEARARAEGLRVWPLRQRAELDPWAAWSLRRLVDEFRPAIVHAHSGHAHALAAVTLRRRWDRGLRIVVSRRVDNPLRGNLASRWKWASGADRILCVSEAVRREVLGNAWIRGERVGLARDAAAPRLERREPRPPVGETPRLVAVGSLVGHKGHEHLIRALALLRRPAELWILGEGPLRGRLEALASELRVEVRLPGFVEGVVGRLKDFDLYVQPSVGEGLGSSILDAMAVGVPVVATDAGGIPEVVIPGRTGRLVPRGSPEALARAIEAANGEEETTLRLALGAQAFVQEFHSVEGMADATLDAYRQALQELPAPFPPWSHIQIHPEKKILKKSQWVQGSALAGAGQSSASAEGPKKSQGSRGPRPLAGAGQSPASPQSIAPPQGRATLHRVTHQGQPCWRKHRRRGGWLGPWLSGYQNPLPRLVRELEAEEAARAAGLPVPRTVLIELFEVTGPEAPPETEDAAPEHPHPPTRAPSLALSPELGGRGETPQPSPEVGESEARGAKPAEVRVFEASTCGGTALGSPEAGAENEGASPEHPHPPTRAPSLALSPELGGRGETPQPSPEVGESEARGAKPAEVRVHEASTCGGAALPGPEVGAENEGASPEHPHPPTRAPSLALSPELGGRGETPQPSPEVGAGRGGAALTCPEVGAGRGGTALVSPKVGAGSGGAASARPEVGAGRAGAASARPEVGAGSGGAALPGPEVAAGSGGAALPGPEVGAGSGGAFYSPLPNSGEGSGVRVHEASTCGGAVLPGPEVAAGSGGAALPGPEVGAGSGGAFYSPLPNSGEGSGVRVHEASTCGGAVLPGPEVAAGSGGAALPGPEVGAGSGGAFYSPLPNSGEGSGVRVHEASTCGGAVLPGPEVAAGSGGAALPGPEVGAGSGGAFYSPLPNSGEGSGVRVHEASTCGGAVLPGPEVGTGRVGAALGGLRAGRRWEIVSLSEDFSGWVDLLAAAEGAQERAGERQGSALHPPGAGGPWTPKVFFVEAGRALRRLHEAGVDHGDLNLKNILIGPKGEAGFIDFDPAWVRMKFSMRLRRARLARLRRSIVKRLGLAEPWFSWILEGYSLPGIWGARQELAARLSTWLHSWLWKRTP